MSFDMTQLKNRLAAEGTITLEIRVRAGSGPEGLETAPDGMLSARVSAPREKGKANLRLVKILTREFSVPKDAVEILRGRTASKKLVRVRTH